MKLVESFSHGNEIFNTGVLLVIFVLLNVIIKKLTHRYAKAAHLSEVRTNLISKYIDYVIILLFFLGTIAIWGVESKEIFNFLGATLTVIGVAFFCTVEHPEQYHIGYNNVLYIPVSNRTYHPRARQRLSCRRAN